MLIAGLICGVVGFLLAIVAALILPAICNPCAAMFIGLGAGVLGCVFAKPPESGASAGQGAGAGAIATVGNLLGQMAGTAANVLLVGPVRGAELVRELGLPTGDPAAFGVGYYGGAFGVGCLCGLIGIALGAGLGALGGLLWYQIAGTSREPTGSSLAGRTCPDCGAEVPTDSEFCDRCGAKL